MGVYVCNSNSFATLVALMEVCTLLSTILVYFKASSVPCHCIYFVKYNVCGVAALC